MSAIYISQYFSADGDTELIIPSDKAGYPYKIENISPPQSTIMDGKQFISVSVEGLDNQKFSVGLVVPYRAKLSYRITSGNKIEYYI